MKLFYIIVMAAGLNTGIIQQYEPYFDTSINQPLFATIKTDIQYGPIFFISNIRTDVYMNNPLNYAPWQISYSVGGGLRFSIVEVGYIHSCSHPIMPYNFNANRSPKFDSADEMFYASITIKND